MQSIAVLKNTIQRAGQEKFITFAKTSSGTMNNSFEIATPIGSLSITLEGDYVTGIARSGTGRHCEPTGVFACAVAKELEEYFSGKRKEFTFGTKMHGTPFCQKVWQRIMHIPYGSTATYGDIAKEIGSPGAARAVGTACNRNPLLLVVPCHRVVGAGGNLTGYVAGLKNKEFLLKLETNY